MLLDDLDEIAASVVEYGDGDWPMGALARHLRLFYSNACINLVLLECCGLALMYLMRELL
jgi:hypothetical protein